MKNLLSFSLLVSMVFAMNSASIAATKENKTAESYLFVVTTQSGNFDGKKLKLVKVSPQALYFTDRPVRKAGHILTSDFISHWDKGSDSFKNDPPNASLTITSKEKTINAVVELKNPKLVGNNLFYDVVVIEGTIPNKFETASLFIDLASADIVMTGGGPGRPATSFQFGSGL